MSPPLNRRHFLQSLGASLWVAGCGDSGLGAAANPPVDPIVTPPIEPSGFDYPLVLPLPFAHGVASGDPLSDRVIIWTRLTEATPSANSHTVRWEVATDPAMTNIVTTGRQITDASRDWTVKVDVVGLQPATTYYYRFSALASTSITGRTRTAPRAMVDNLRFAVASCSSYWSSTWSGYGHIANRNDLDLVIHLGDYIYDFIDEDEFVRSRNDNRDLGHPDQRDWLNIQELRRRYALFRSDPNLMRAHQQHPWFMVWDNHDIDDGYGNELPTPQDGQTSTATLAQTTQVFWEWTPSRPPLADGSGQFLLVDDGSYPAPPNSLLLYRRLPYGPLAEFIGVDTQIGLPGYGLTLDNGHLGGTTPTLYGRPQFDWATQTLLAAEQAGVTWKVVANQTWFAPADVPQVGGGAPATPQLGISRWADYPEERAAWMQYLRGSNAASQRIHGTVLLSGDAHGNFCSDLIEDNSLATTYQSGTSLRSTRNGSTVDNTGAGYIRANTGNTALTNNRANSVGVEFAPTSLGRGGADELIANANPSNPQAANVSAARQLEQALIQGNKNVQFIEWVDHGYGVVDLTVERALFEHWWQDKLRQDSPDVLGMQMVAWATDNSSALPAPHYRDQIDAVTLHGLAVTASVGTRSADPAPLDTALVRPR